MCVYVCIYIYIYVYVYFKKMEFPISRTEVLKPENIVTRPYSNGHLHCVPKKNTSGAIQAAKTPSISIPSVLVRLIAIAFHPRPWNCSLTITELKHSQTIWRSWCIPVVAQRFPSPGGILQKRCSWVSQYNIVKQFRPNFSGSISSSD